MYNPPHPGEFIRGELLEPLGLTVTAAADVLGVSRPTLSTLLNENSDLSPDMALRIEKAFGIKNGHAPTDAKRLRHFPDPQTRGTNQGEALRPETAPRSSDRELNKTLIPMK